MPQRSPIDAAMPSAVGAVTVRTASPRSRLWIDHLSRAFVLNVGYVPKHHRAQRLVNFDYWLVSLDQEPAGFLLIGGGTRAPVRISQIAIDADLWRCGLGAACVEVVRAYAAFQPRPDVHGDIAFGLPMEAVASSTRAVQTCSRLHLSCRGRRTGHWRWDPLDALAVAGTPHAAAAARSAAASRPLPRSQLVAAAAVNGLATPPPAAAAGVAVVGSMAGRLRASDRASADLPPPPQPPPPAAAAAAAGGPCAVRAGVDGPLVIRPRNAADGF